MNKISSAICSKIREKRIVVTDKMAVREGFAAVTVIAVTAALLGAAGAAFGLDPNTLPTGGRITAGSGVISSSGNRLTVNQSTQQMIANWNTFNIGAKAGVQFVQPNAQVTALNRISDQNPSQILGSLTANGRVFLLNPSGIIFGQGAQVNVGGLVASSLNMLESDFLAGRYRLSGSGGGAVLNQGSITTPAGGVVALIAPRVMNEGSISTPNGSVALAAGNQVTLDFGGDGLLNLAVTQGAVDAQVANKGLITVEGGLAVMTARAASTLTAAAVNNEGIIEAKGMSSKGGKILLDAVGGSTTVSGVLDASSTTGGGGDITVTGDTVTVGSTAHLNASGTTGGGRRPGWR